MDDLIQRLRKAANALPPAAPEPPHPLYGLMHDAAHAISRLHIAIQRIDGINDNPAHYNPEINAECDRILRPELLTT